MERKKIRVLFAIPNLNGGGAERMALDLASKIDRTAFDVTLFIHERRGSLLSSVDPSTRTVFKNDSNYSRLQLPGILFETVRLARSADLLVGANEGRASFFAIIAGLVLRKPVICWLHNNWALFSLTTSWRQKMSLRAYTFSAQIVSCSQGVADAFSSITGISAAKMKTIFNGLPIESIQKKSNLPINATHEEIFNKPTVISVGRLDYQKGQEFLLVAHAKLVRAGIDHNLVILGAGPEEELRRAQAAELGVTASVYFLGFQENPFAYMRRSTVFALSSRFEGFALVIAEAMACGLPVVSADCPSGPREVLDNGKCGMLVGVEDSTALAEGLKAMLANASLREHYRTLSLERCLVFGADDIVKEWECLMRRVVPQN